MALSLSWVSFNWKSPIPCPDINTPSLALSPSAFYFWTLWWKGLIGKTREETGFSEPDILVFSFPSPQSIFGSPLWEEAVLKHALWGDPGANLYWGGVWEFWDNKLILIKLKKPRGHLGEEKWVINALGVILKKLITNSGSLFPNLKKICMLRYLLTQNSHVYLLVNDD